MKLNKIKLELEKIESLLNSIKKSSGGGKAIERDLMLSYIRKMYEFALTEKTYKNGDPSTKKNKNALKKKVAERWIDKAEEIIEAPKELEEMPEVPLEEPDTESQEEEIQSPALHIPEEVSTLFTHRKAVEISEKLGESPINDLTKALGINEKVFTIKELFGGKQKLFNDTIDRLNSFTQFEEAKDYLIKNVAVDLNWGDDGKKKKASHFIKIIRRRYK